MKQAFVFPGQGSQSVGMLADLYAEYATVRDVFVEASDALQYDLWVLISQGPDSALNETERTQPALLASGVALYRTWRELGGVEPAYLAGHSLGEYTALVCAQALSLQDGVKLVAERGRLMQQAVPVGTGSMMVVLGLEDNVVQSCCAGVAGQGVVEAVNFNAPGQVVIAGDKAAVDQAAEACRAAGAKRVLPLPVSVPSHCALMRPAAEQLGAYLESLTLHLPVIPVLHNVNVKTSSSLVELREALVQQLYSPVQWVGTIHELAQAGVRRAYECGPGKVLCGLNKRIVKELDTLPLESVKDFQAALTAN